jgi:ribosomal protein L37AE/L43A
MTTLPLAWEVLKNMNEQLEKFRETVKTQKNIVVCVQCGSTAIDQYSVSTIQCSDCGNVWIWDAKRFTIARNADETDAAEGLDYKRRHFRPEIPIFREEIVAALEPLAVLVSKMTVRMDKDGASAMRSDFNGLAAQWDDTKKVIDEELRKLQSEGRIIPD